jgi:hypothetical protein
MLTKSQKRALRRRRNSNIKNKARKIARDIYHIDPEIVVKYFNHLKLCSCWMCGNPRKHFGRCTKQEEIMIQKEREMLQESFEDFEDRQEMREFKRNLMKGK